MISTDTALGLPVLPDATTVPNSPNQSLYPLTAELNPQGHLEIGGCDVVSLAATYGTPLYIMDELTVRAACRHYTESLARHYPAPSLVLYATKAWNCLSVCALVAQEGLGLDVVSGGELYTALQAGVPGDRLYLHGNYKSDAELTQAIEAGSTIVVDNPDELARLLAILETCPGVRQRVMLRITPGIECHTHEYIRTGHIDSKFGLDASVLTAVLTQIKQTSALEFVGFHAHIGSQIFELAPHQDLGAVLCDLWQQALGLGLQPSELNVGGGLGMRYVSSDDPPSIDEWVQAVSQGVLTSFTQAGLPLPKLLCEPGRSLIGPSTVTAYTVGGAKTIPTIRTYITVDGGMSDNPRPITYQAPYTAIWANNPRAPLTQKVTVAGKHCESGDVLLKDVALPAIPAGDTLVVLGTGAYNYSMASNYNRLSRPATVLVHQGQATEIIRRETYQDLIRHDVLPTHLRLGDG